MNRYQPMPPQQRGQIARAMAGVQEHKDSVQDVRGAIACTRCGGRLTFNVQPSGISRGQCTTAGCISWCN